MVGWLVMFYGISTLIGYLIPNPVYTYILNIYDLVLVDFMAFNPCRLFNSKSCLYIYTRYIGFGLVSWHINPCSLFNSKSGLYICIEYMWFGLVGLYGIPTLVSYLMPNPVYTYIYIIYIWSGLVWFYDISTIRNYSMPNPLNTYILNIDL